MSYFKALQNNENCVIYSIGIQEHKDLKNYYNIDLSLNNFNLIDQLKLIPKPDIIIASPPCESWSRADCSLAIWKDISKTSWELNNYEFYKTVETTKNKKRDFYSKEQKRVLGESTAGATAYIINVFQPKVWIIENPFQSFIWKFLKFHHNLNGIKNNTYYSSYNKEFSVKPTCFYSNINLNLKNKRKPGNAEHYSKGSYYQRSMIPKELIKDLFLNVFVQLKKISVLSKEYTKNYISNSLEKDQISLFD
ncbi:c-5 cytosine-specific DNA methylase [Mycoplasmopsis fermentans]|nr:c-5 cytosine-specific DNA methylase [Mycoplasmopsis fermentans]